MADGQVVVELRLATDEFEQGLAEAERLAVKTAGRMEAALGGGAGETVGGLGARAVRAADEFGRAMQEMARAAGVPSGAVGALAERFLALSEELPVSAAALAAFSGEALALFDELGGADADRALRAFAAALEGLGAQGMQALGPLGELAGAQESLRAEMEAAAEAGERLASSLELGGDAFGRSGEQAERAGARYELLGERMERLRERMDRVFEAFGTAAQGSFSAAAAGIDELGSAAEGAVPGLLSTAAALLSVASGIAAVEQLLGKRSSNKISVDTLGIGNSLEKYRSLVQSAARGASMSAYAAGTGWAEAGWALVGEQGPELVLLRGGEQILNAASTAGLVRAMSAGTASTAAGTPAMGESAGAAYYDQSSLTVQTSDDRVLQEIRSWWTHRRMRARAGGGR